jgi:hypothetical protein
MGAAVLAKMIIRAVIVWTVFLSVSTLAFGAEYERWLLPLATNSQSGLLGSSWSTGVYGTHTGEGILVRGFDYRVPFFAPSEGMLYTPIPFFTEPGEPPGSILYVPKETVEHVHLTARLGQRGAGRQDLTSLPVVPERNFVAGTLYFLGLDKQVDERLMLRVYSLDLDRSDAAVRVRIEAPVDEFPRRETIFDAEVPLVVRQRMTSLFGEVFAVRPLAVEIPLDEPLQRAKGEGRIVITVAPAVQGLRIWGFISETDNATNRVQLITPQ